MNSGTPLPKSHTQPMHYSYSLIPKCLFGNMSWESDKPICVHISESVHCCILFLCVSPCGTQLPVDPGRRSGCESGIWGACTCVHISVGAPPPHASFPGCKCRSIRENTRSTEDRIRSEPGRHFWGIQKYDGDCNMYT